MLCKSHLKFDQILVASIIDVVMYYKVVVHNVNINMFLYKIKPKFKNCFWYFLFFDSYNYFLKTVVILSAAHKVSPVAGR